MAQREEVRGQYLKVADVQQALGSFPRGEQAPLIRLGDLSGAIYCVTKYRVAQDAPKRGVIVVARKYDVTDQVLAVVKAWSRFHKARKRKLARARR